MLMSFLGILTFSLAGVLMRKSKLQNFSFALVAFFGGLYFLFDTLNYYMPLIIDNPQNRTPTHLGIENIKERISTMCNGDVTIESEAGKGTVSTIKIFKDTKGD